MPKSTNAPSTQVQKNDQRKDGNVEYRRLTREELEKLAGEALPERAAMSLINANVAAPINAAVALNALSDNSVAYAEATQAVQIDQSTGPH